VETKPADPKVETIKGRLKDLMGLPAGDKTPYGAGQPPRKDTVPEGGLTAPDAQGLPPHAGTGVRAE
jgi:hypothetical protein